MKNTEIKIWSWNVVQSLSDIGDQSISASRGDSPVRTTLLTMVLLSKQIKASNTASYPEISAWSLDYVILTMTATASLAVKAKMSAQETTLGHFSSSKLLMLSMKSNPRSVKLGVAAFSA
ncbi:hypothetical protein IEQ34_016909 [Dendrobium chrysotoxum]|uniref:Uncharacterized protein n=1 Tax=Dendrobium chrysotoxum TaxID=161865 RepID=A0AAV7GGV4_DENCH|nr:hypothetical protein IEQ34_016909 [Dendrobium chrysotoxum]